MGGELTLILTIGQAPAQLPPVMGQVLFVGSLLVLAILLWRFSKIK